jgi:hypothetical protein
MISEMEGMNTGIEIERFYIRKERVEKIISQSFGLMFIKPEAIEQIFLGKNKDFDSHLI